MKISNLGFSLEEKFAIVHAMDTIIAAKGTLHASEIEVVSQLMKRFDFDTSLILQARNMNIEQGHTIFRHMTPVKRKALSRILGEIEMASGVLIEKESSLIDKLFSHIGIGQETMAAK